MLLERYERRRHADHLFAVERSARPGQLQPPITVQSGIAARGVKPLVAVVEQRVRRPGVRQQDRWEHERFDVPHHLAAVVVVVGPVRETEHRGTEERSRMRRRVHVVERGVGERLPATSRADELDAAAPQIVPCLAVLLTKAVESELRADGCHSRRLAMGLAVTLARDERGNRSDDLGHSGTGSERIRRAQGSSLVVFLALLLRVFGALKKGQIRRAARAEPAVAFPQERAVHHGLLSPRSAGLAFLVATRDVLRVDGDGDRKIAIAVGCDTELVEHERWLGAAAKDQVLGIGTYSLDLEREPRAQLATGEVVALLDEPAALRMLAELHAIEGDIAGQRIRPAGESLDLVDGMHRRETVDDGEPLDERDPSGAQADKPVREVCRDVFGLVVGDGRGADRSAHSASVMHPRCQWLGRSDLLRRNDDRLAGHRLAARAGRHADPSERPPFARLM